jgi:integrase
MLHVSAANGGSPSVPRKIIAEHGSHGRSVRVFVETFGDKRRQDLVRAQWREGGKRRTESMPFSRENVRTVKAFAVGVASRLALPGADKRVRLKMHELGERFVAAHPVGEVWRRKTLKTWTNRWKVWSAFATPDRFIDSVTMETLDQFRAAMRVQGYAVNQIANHVQMVKSVYTFARERGYIGENAIAGYRMRLSKDQRRMVVGEWTNEECAKILAQFSKKDSRQWRPLVAITLDAVLGARSNALLNLEWRDVDLNARIVRWRPELDKLAKDREQPLPRDAVYALRVARVWRERMKYTGPFVLPAVKKSRRGAYTYQALNNQLRLAAKAAGLRWVKYKAMHAFRRMVVNNVLALTGNITRAGQYIGDTDLKTLGRSYVRERADDLRDVAGMVSLQPSGNGAKSDAS